jgi:hypothetical protein
MQECLYPENWKQRSHACISQAGYRCEHCGIAHRAVRFTRRGIPYFVHLHAAHIHHDPHNPSAELRALCPSCHMRHDRNTERKWVAARKQGYPVISLTRLTIGVRAAGLHIIQEGACYSWQIGDLSGEASDVLDAIGSALHCLLMERMEGQA